MPVPTPLGSAPRASLSAILAACCPLQAGLVVPELADDLACHYDFEHPVEENAGKEQDLGFSGTDIDLVNGGAAMRIADGAHAGSHLALQTQQVNPASEGNDDWKAGIYQAGGLASLAPFGSVSGITVMGWVKPTGTNPNLNSNTADPDDYYNAVGLFGLLSGDSEGHGVRALLEIINVSGDLKLVALGRRIDGGNSWILAADTPWTRLVPPDRWTHLAASFDFDAGSMELYRNGEPIAATLTSNDDRWGVNGPPEPDLSSATPPAGIKIGGSYPQDNDERNPFNGRFDDLMFFDRALDSSEVLAQYSRFPVGDPPALSILHEAGSVTLSWPESATAYDLESAPGLDPEAWSKVDQPPSVDDGWNVLTLPAEDPRRFFRLSTE